ncbi:MAG TPA: hypothetical protein VJH24_05655 [Candidatus Bilamarchaeaceae archaeon]|nr:hypothetical protein [Candidatus Bilamarchaeaceae archaeon]
MEIALRKLDVRGLKTADIERQSPRIRGFLGSMLALEDPLNGTQINVGLRRIGVGREGRILRPKVVTVEQAREIFKGDRNAVVVLGNGGHSPVAEPDVWFAASAVGKANGTVPFVFEAPNISVKEQLVYAAPALVIGRGNSKVEAFEVEIAGPVNLKDISRALRQATRTPRTYSMLELEEDSRAEATSKYQATATYTYSYTTSYSTGKCEDVHPERFEAQGKPLTLLVSANRTDTHAIDETGRNVHMLDLKIPEGVSARGVAFTLA